MTQNKNMRTGGDRAAGFTVIETLIVLSVSAIMTISALTLISGRQNKTEFQVAANDMKQQLEQIINETANGYYQRRNDFKCNGNTPAANPPSILSGSSKQGTNSSCIFLGKAISFAVGTNASGSFVTYPLIGKRYVTVGGIKTEVSSFDQAVPIALADDGSLLWPSSINYADTRQTKNGLKLVGARYRIVDTTTGTVSTTTSKPYAVLALANSLAQYSTVGSDVMSSATQSLELYEYDRSSNPVWAVAPTNSKDTVSKINTANIDSKIISEALLCYVSGGTKQSALLTISGRGQLSVALKIYGNLTCS